MHQIPVKRREDKDRQVADDSSILALLYSKFFTSTPMVYLDPRHLNVI